MLKKVALLMCVGGMVWVAAPRSWGQTTTATLSGTLTDESGAVLPGAQVTVTNVATGAQRAVPTDERGRFVAPQLAPGPYQITATMPGFETLVRTGITLTVGQQANLNLAMKVGAVSEQVTVTGEAPLVDTSGSSVSGVVEERRIVELPLNGRDFTQLALVQPGVFSVRNTDSVASKGYGTRISMAGSRPDQTAWLLDGTNIKSTSNFGTPGSAAGVILGVDAVREFQVLTSNYSAEFGGTSGGVVNLVTKSGTNELHGTTYWFHRNDNLDARKFFDRAKPEFKRNQYGVSVGGPIQKDKAFFFANYEGLRQREGLTQVAIVPDENAHRGLIPAATGGLQQVQVAPIVRPYLDVWPLPNAGLVLDRNGNPTGLGTIFAASTDSIDEHYVMGRADYRLGDNQTLFSRFTYDRADDVKPDALPATGTAILTSPRYATIQYERIFTPHFLGTSRVAYNRSRLVADVTVNIDYPASLYIFNKNMPPTFIFPGVTSFGPDSRNQRVDVQNLYQFSESLVYSRGDHSTKFGVDYQHSGLHADGGPRDNGDMSWNSLRDFLEDNRFRTFQMAAPGSTSSRSFKQEVVGLYFQDDWKLYPKFTLNLGLRYETFTTPKEKHRRVSIIRDWVRATSFEVSVPFFENPSKKNFSPRVGFAWDPGGQGKTAIRGGFGLFFVPLLGSYFRTPSYRNPPFAARIETVQGNLTTALADVARVGPTVLTPVMNPNSFMELIQYYLNSSYEMKYNLTVQRQLAGDLTVVVGYLAGRGIHLWRTADVNAAPPTIVDGRPFVAANTPRLNRNTGVGTTRYSDAQSFYNGLQVELRKRFSQSFQFQSSYTWSKNVDDTTTGVALTDFNEGATPQPYNPKADRGLSSLHLGQNFVLNGVYLLPSAGSSGLANHLLGGWQVSGIFSASTGTPFTVYVAGRNAPDLSRNAARQHPDLIAGRSFKDIVRGGPDEYFDPGAFTLPPAGFYGNAGRNILIGPGFANVDFSLMKTTPLGISEGSRLEFRAEFFNLLNRANFAVPSFTQVFNTAPRGPIAGAGKITRTVSSSRQLQFGLRLVY